MKRDWIIYFISLPVMILWIYVGMDKFFNWEEHYRAFLNQPLPQNWSTRLATILPTLELLLGGFLLFPRFRWFGFLGSVLLLAAFSTYVGLVWIGVFPEVPCSCAGIFRQLLWGGHVIVNLIFLLLSLIGLYLSSNQEGQ